MSSVFSSSFVPKFLRSLGCQASRGPKIARFCSDFRSNSDGIEPSKAWPTHQDQSELVWDGTKDSDIFVRHPWFEGERDSRLDQYEIFPMVSMYWIFDQDRSLENSSPYANWPISPRDLNFIILLILSSHLVRFMDESVSRQPRWIWREILGGISSQSASLSRLR